MATPLDLKDVQFDYGVPAYLLRELTRRKCLPSWWPRLASNQDWIASFVRALTQDLPRHLREVSAGSIQTSLSPQAQISATGSMIVFPISTVVLLHELIEIVCGHPANYGSSDLYAQMRRTPEFRIRAVTNLRAMIGRLRSTRAPDCTTEIPDKWNPGAVAAAHFMTCHELNHISHFNRPNSPTFFQDEFDADAHGCMFMQITLRSNPLFQELFVFLGPVIALALEAVKEAAFPIDEWVRTHPRTSDRVRFLRDRVQEIELHGLLPSGTVEVGDEFWTDFQDLLAEAKANPDKIPDPVYDLFAEPEPSSEQVVNSVLQWCAFGSEPVLLESLARAYRGERTDRVLFDELLLQTKHLEPSLGLGLARQLSLPPAPPTPATRYTLIARRLLSEQLRMLPRTPEDSDLMKMWMRVLFESLTASFDAADTVTRLLADQSAADTGFATIVVYCNHLVSGLSEGERRDRMCREAAEIRIPRIAVLTTWLVEAFEQGWFEGVKQIDTCRPMRVGKLIIVFGFLLRRDAPEVVSLLLSEYKRKE